MCIIYIYIVYIMWTIIAPFPCTGDLWCWSLCRRWRTGAAEVVRLLPMDAAPWPAAAARRSAGSAHHWWWRIAPAARRIPHRLTCSAVAAAARRAQVIAPGTRSYYRPPLIDAAPRRRDNPWGDGLYWSLPWSWCTPRWPCCCCWLGEEEVAAPAAEGALKRPSSCN